MNLSEKTLKLFTDYTCNKIEKLNPIQEEFYQYCISDLNSSKLREELTMHIGGYEPIPTKLGYDAIDKNTGRYIEAKPKLFTKKATNGSGSFSDLSISKLKKIESDNINIVTSLFAYDRLIFIMEFPFEYIYDRIYEQVYEKCVVKSNQFARSSSFTYEHYMDCPQLQIKYINWDVLDDHPNVVNKKFFNKLKAKAFHGGLYQFYQM